MPFVGAGVAAPFAPRSAIRRPLRRRRARTGKASRPAGRAAHGGDQMRGGSRKRAVRPENRRSRYSAAPTRRASCGTGFPAPCCSRRPEGDWRPCRARGWASGGWVMSCPCLTKRDGKQRKNKTGIKSIRLGRVEWFGFFSRLTARPGSLAERLRDQAGCVAVSILFLQDRGRIRWSWAGWLRSSAEFHDDGSGAPQKGAARPEQAGIQGDGNAGRVGRRRKGGRRRFYTRAARRPAGACLRER